MSENGSNGNGKIIVLQSVSEGRFAHTITQEDLFELKLLSREFSEAREAWETKRDWVKAALRAGARLEDGVLTVELVKGTGGGYTVEIYDFEKVVVR